jgi:hypothetical protein
MVNEVVGILGMFGLVVDWIDLLSSRKWRINLNTDYYYVRVVQTCFYRCDKCVKFFFKIKNDVQLCYYFQRNEKNLRCKSLN